MKKTQETLRREDSRKEAVLHLAFELSNTKRKLAFSDCSKRRLVTINARNLEQLQEEIEKAKLRFKLSDDVRVVSCYEAGRDGFSLHRYVRQCMGDVRGPMGRELFAYAGRLFFRIRNIYEGYLPLEL